VEIQKSKKKKLISRKGKELVGKSPRPLLTPSFDNIRTTVTSIVSGANTLQDGVFWKGSEDHDLAGH